MKAGFTSGGVTGHELCGSHLNWHKARPPKWLTCVTIHDLTANRHHPLRVSQVGQLSLSSFLGQ